MLTKRWRCLCYPSGGTFLSRALNLLRHQDVVYTPSKKPVLSGAEMLSLDALETSLIASYDAGSDAGVLPTFSPYSQSSRQGDTTSPGRGAFSRSLLSPPRSVGKGCGGGGSGGGSGEGGMWQSPQASAPFDGRVSCARSDSDGDSSLSHCPPSPSSRSGGYLSLIHI